MKTTRRKSQAAWTQQSGGVGLFEDYCRSLLKQAQAATVLVLVYRAEDDVRRLFPSWSVRLA